MHEVLQVFISQLLSRIDYPVHISFHQLCYNVDVLVAGRCRWLKHINQINDVLLVEEFEEFDLPYYTLRINEVFKRFRNLLDCDFRPSLMVVRAANDTIGTVAYLFYIFVLGANGKCSTY